MTIPTSISEKPKKLRNIMISFRLKEDVAMEFRRQLAKYGEVLHVILGGFVMAYIEVGKKDDAAQEAKAAEEKKKSVKEVKKKKPKPKRKRYAKTNSRSR